MKKVVAIIQARMGSTRLPGKVMKKIKNKTVLGHVISRIKQSNNIDEIVIATTELSRDDVIVDEALKYNVGLIRGSEEDVLERYYLAAKKYNADIVVRITSDCPLIDPHVTDEIIKKYVNENYVLVTNAGLSVENRTYPRGLDTEVFSFDILKEAHIKAKKNYQREHVTPYIYQNYANQIYFYKNDIDYSEYRWTLDTEEDFKLIKSIYNEMYFGKHNFYLKDIIKLFKENPGLKKLNQNVKQKSIK